MSGLAGRISSLPEDGLPGQARQWQLCWVDSEAYVKKEYWRHSVSAFAKSVPFLNEIIKWAPRKL